MVHIPKKDNSANAFLYGRFIDTDEMMTAIATLEDMCVKLQHENKDLKKKLGMPVNEFDYRLG